MPCGKCLLAGIQDPCPLGLQERCSQYLIRAMVRQSCSIHFLKNGTLLLGFVEPSRVEKLELFIPLMFRRQGQHAFFQGSWSTAPVIHALIRTFELVLRRRWLCPSINRICRRSSAKCCNSSKEALHARTWPGALAKAKED